MERATGPAKEGRTDERTPEETEQDWRRVWGKVGRKRRVDTGTEHNLTHNARVVDALAEVLISGVVCEPAELVLDGLGQRRLVDVRVLRLLARELGVEVGRVQYRFLHTKFTCVCRGNEHDMMSA